MMYNINLTDVTEPKVMPRGVYSLRIFNAEANQEDGKNNIRCYIEFADHPDAQSFSHWCALPLPADDPSKVKTKLLMTRRFLELFKIPYSADGFDIQDFFGATATGMIDMEVMTNREGVVTTDSAGNPRYVNRLNPPQLQGEKGPVETAPRRQKR